MIAAPSDDPTAQPSTTASSGARRSARAVAGSQLASSRAAGVRGSLGVCGRGMCSGCETGENTADPTPEGRDEARFTAFRRRNCAQRADSGASTVRQAPFRRSSRWFRPVATCFSAPSRLGGAEQRRSGAIHGIPTPDQPLRRQLGPFGAVWRGAQHGIVSVAPCRDPLAQRCALPTCTRERSIARRSPAWTHVICSSSASGIGSGAVISEVASSLSNWT